MRLLVILLLFGAHTVQSATNTAASTSAAAVQAAIDASSNGDTVIVPAGSSTWATEVSCTKALEVIGNGIGSTVITYNNGGAAMLSINAGSGRVTWRGFTFTDANGGSFSGIIELEGTNYRFCSNRIASIIHAGIQVNGESSGVTDHCEFATTANATGIQFLRTTNSWDSSVTWGTTNADFVESCSFSFAAPPNNGAVDAFNGAKYVFRYNTVTNTLVGHHGCDSGSYRSVFSCEVYSNYFIIPSGTIDSFLQSRGGAGMYWSNRCEGANNGILKLQNFREGGTGSTCATELGGCPPWGNATGSNAFDGNSDAEGYPTLDQCGRTGPTTFGATNSTQTLAPVHFWVNTVDASNFDMINADDTIQTNRDFYGIAPTNYTALVFPHPRITADEGGGGIGSATFTFTGSGTFSGTMTLTQ